MDRLERLAYFAEHDALYTATIAAFESVLIATDDDYRTCLYKDASMGQFVFLEGEFTAEDCVEAERPTGEDYWPSNPGVIAEGQNDLLLKRANAALGFLRSFTNYLRPDDMPPQFELDGTPMPPPYQTAVWRHCTIEPDEESSEDPTLKGRVSVMELYGVQFQGKIGKAALYELTRDQNDVRDSFRITTINDKVEMAGHLVTPLIDELRQQCYDMFGPDSMASRLMGGDFDSVEELDSCLADITRATREIFPDNDVDSLMTAIRERALANKDAEELSALLALYMPDPGTIKRMRAFLQSVKW